jgi:hypothetical protein
VKIGLSYSRCLRDIVDGKVNINDVLVIIARTNFDPLDDDQWQGIWGGYGGGHTVGGIWSNPEWNGYGPEREAEFRSITVDLLEQGKLFQPRQHGAHPRRLPYYWLDTVLTPEELDSNPAVKSAWEQFQIVAGLSGINLNRDHR